jgi:hypothetical protein
VHSWQQCIAFTQATHQCPALPPLPSPPPHPTPHRTERLKLEKEYLELQGKAFAAPGSALAEVRGLREELLRVRRDKALGEAKEADLRRELAGFKRQVRRGRGRGGGQGGGWCRNRQGWVGGGC